MKPQFGVLLLSTDKNGELNAKSVDSTLISPVVNEKLWEVKI